MNSNYILDFVISTADLSQELKCLSSPFWFVIKSDGLNEQLASTEAFGPYPRWNYPARLILELQDFSRAYIYFTLYTKGPNGAPIALGRSRFGLRSLQGGAPKQYQFPLMSAQNLSQEAAQVKIAFTLSKVVRSNEGYKTYPVYIDQYQETGSPILPKIDCFNTYRT